MKNLRPYQASSIESLREGFRAGHVRQVLSAPTGAGKSIVMLSMIQSALDKGSRILFVCERRILVDQMSHHLESIHIDHGILMAGHWRFRPEKQVQVASAQTLERMQSIPQVDVVFIDEVHACLRASILRLMAAQPSLRIIGATATPFHPVLGKYFSNVASVTTMAELVQQGFLVPFRVFVAKEIDTTGLKVVAGEWKKDDLEKRGQQIVGDVVADYIRISHDVFGGYRKTICFSCGIAHGAELARQFNEAGVPALQLSSEDNEDYRQDVLREFAKPDTDIRVLISVAILSRGFDQSDVEHVILARPLKKSFSEHVQMVGRGARIHPDKALCVVQCNSGNWLRFADDWDQLYHEGVQELGQGQDAKVRKEPTQQEKEAAKCPKCSALWTGGKVCGHCGYERVKANEVIAVAGAMEEVGATGAKRQKKGKDEFTAQGKSDFYAELLGHAESKGFKSGWAYFAYQARMGVAPSMARPQPVPPSPATQGWIKHFNIRKAKSHAKGRAQ